MGVGVAASQITGRAGSITHVFRGIRREKKENGTRGVEPLSNQ